MSDARVSKYAVAMHAMTCDATRLPPCPVDGHLSWIRWAEAAAAMADAEQEALRQECRDRECTEQDVRARLADTENTLALVRALHYRRPWRAMQDSSTFGQSVFPDQCHHCRTAWPCNTGAALDGTS